MELPNNLHIVELELPIVVAAALILTNLELPTSFTANSLTLSDEYDAYRVAPLDKVGLVLVSTNPKDVPIPFVITEGVDAVKLPDALLDCEFVKLNAVVPEWLYPDGYKFQRNTEETRFPPAFT